MMKRLALVILTLVAFAWRAQGLAWQSLWRDEVDAIYFATRHLPETLMMFVQPGQNGPLYFVALRPWFDLMGTSEFALRYPSAVAGTLATLLTWQVARRLLPLTPAEGGAETSLVLLHHVPRLGAGAVGNAAAGRAGRCGGEGRQRRYHVDVALRHHLCRVVVHEGGMFDGVDACAERVLHPGCAVGVGGHMSPVGDGHFDGSGQFCHGHLRVVRRGAGGEHAAGGNDFDDFGAGIELIQDGCADGLDSVGFAADEARMSAGHADRETGGKNT